MNSIATPDAGRVGDATVIVPPNPHRVVGGECEVYLSRDTEGQRPIRGRFVGVVPDGGVCCAGDADFGSAEDGAPRLILRSTSSAAVVRLQPVGVDGLDEATVLGWMRLLLNALHTSSPPAAARRLEAHDRLIVDANQAIVCAEGATWITIENGSAYLFGRRSHVAHLRRGTWVLPSGSWMLVQEAGCIRSKTWSVIVEEGVAESAITQSASLLRSLLAQDARMRSTIELKRLEVRSAEERRLMNASCLELAKVLEPDASGPKSGDALEAVLFRVAAESGIKLHERTLQAEGRPTARLKAFARANQFRTRRVALRGRWWSGECGSMVGAWRKAEGKTPVPVAIRRVPPNGIRGSRYVIWNPVDDVEVAVDSESAANLSPFAYAFYRPMPREPYRLGRLLRLGLDGSQWDGITILALGIIAGGLAAFTPVLTGKVYDVAIPEASRSQLLQIVALLLSMGVAAALLQYVRALAVLRVETRLDEATQAGVWDHLFRLPVQFFRRFTAGDLAIRAGGVGQIRQLLSTAVTTALLTGIFSAWYLALLFYYDRHMALWVTGALALLAFVSSVLAWLQLRHQRTATHIQVRLSGLVLQLVTGLSKLRVAAAEIRAFSRWATGFAEQRRAYVSGRRAGNVLAGVQAAAPLLLLALVYGLVTRDGTPGLSTGSFLAFQTALFALIGASVSITSALAAASAAMPLFEQLQPILRCERESDVVRSDPGALTGDVEIRHVTFSYAPDTAPALNDVSIHVPAGAFVALVGPSGSGKSSLLRLLLGFESAQSGSIYFDGQDISGLDLHALRRQFGVVLQEAGVLSGDIYTNIAGSSEASLEEAWEAARMAGLANDIRAMPMGMHTVIDQNGTTISGGQRQRLMIARAIVHRPRILLFDEATSALDNVTQQHVSSSLNALNVTRVVVAHRLSTIIEADCIYALDRGRVVESGTYDELMKLGGLFYRLARRQMT